LPDYRSERKAKLELCIRRAAGEKFLVLPA